MNSCIYDGWVRHRREAPVGHAFRYPLFMMYLDLDELDRVFAKRWLWSTRRLAPAWFRRRDYFGDPNLTLKEAVLREIQSATGIRPAGPVRVLTHLRYWGYSFNPISLYFCYGPDGEDVQAVIAEVRNTPWGERKPYVLTHNLAGETRHRRQYRFTKQMHVSPFMEMAMTYHMHLTVPGETLTVHIANETPAGTHFDATMSLTRKPITGMSLAGVLLRYPWMTATVVAAIHWQALKLWWKGVPYVPHPRATPLRETRIS